MMGSHFYTFLAGAAFMLAVQWLAFIPSMRRHRVVMALLERAKAYQSKAKAARELGRDAEALHYWKESVLIIQQIEAMRNDNKTTR